MAGEDFFYGKLKDIRATRQLGDFYSIHRSYFVNVNAVKGYKYEEVIMMNGDLIQISQANRAEFRKVQLKRVKGEQ